MCRLFLVAAPENGRLFPELYALEASGLPLFPWEKEAMLARVVANFREGYGTAGHRRDLGAAAADMAAQARQRRPAAAADRGADRR